MKAVVLAAGEGTRLEPLTDVRPKPMLPIANCPLVEYVVEAVADADITEIVLVVGYKRERLQSYFGDGDDWDIPITYAVQEKQLGTGHAILQAEPYVDGEFLVLNGDRILEPTLVAQFVDERHHRKPLLAVTQSDRPSDYGVVEIARDRIVGITEKPSACAASSDIINAGVYGFDPEIFDVIRTTETDGELTITAALDRIATYDVVQAARYQGVWLDVSYLWDLLDVNARILDRGHNGVAETARVHGRATVAETVTLGDDTLIQPNVTVLRGTSIGDNVRIGSNTVIENSILLSDVTVGAGAVIRDCVIGANAHVGPNTTVEGGRADVIVDGRVYEGVKLGAVIGDNATLGGNVTVSPGTVVGNGVTVESGTGLAGRIETDTAVGRG